MLDLLAPFQIHSLAIAIPLALLPAALNLWWTRQLPVGGDDTALPERHMALAQRVSAAAMSCALGIGIVAGWQALWIVPVEAVALVSSKHHTRQRLFGETWSLHSYLKWRLRMFGGVWAYWVCLALTPAMIAHTPSSLRWWAAAVSVVVLLAWNHWYTRVVLFVLGATRLARADLDERFQQVFRSARVAAPEVWRVGCKGGTLMNALALPSLTGNGVLFFDLLLERLSVEEISAILAHEVAHLEHYTPRLRRLSLIGVATIVVFVLIGAMGDRIWGELPSWLPVISIAAVIAGLALRAQRMQPKETEADLRAVDLCGNAEALISGLTHVYTVNHIPRRWSTQTEERATHPSLARRIADIRRHAEAPDPLPSTQRLVIASPEQGRWTIIEHDRITFLWNVAAATGANTDIVDRAKRLERLALSELSELRMAVDRGGALALTAVDRHARRWSMPLNEADAARVQAALDRVDHLIVASRPARGRSVGFGRRWVAIMALMIATTFGMFAAVIVPALLVLRRPSYRLLIALSMALVGTAIAIAANGDLLYTEMLVLAMLSGFALWEARGLDRNESVDGRSAWRLIEPLAFTLPLVTGIALFVIDTRDLYDLHVAIRDQPWVPASAMALSAFLWFSPGRMNRRTSSIAAVIAAAALSVSSPWFLRGVVGDDLVASMPLFEEKTSAMTMVDDRTVDGRFSSISLASNGHTFLLSAMPDDDDDETEDETFNPRRYLVGTADGWSRAFDASQAVLVDAHRLLVLERTTEGSRLHVEDVRTGAIAWTLPLRSKNVLQIQAAEDGRWRAVTRRGRQVTRIDGRIDSADTRETVWTITPRDGYADSRVGEGPIALGTVNTWREPLLFGALGDWHTTTRFVRLSGDEQNEIASSRLRVDCPVAPIGATAIACVGFDGRWSKIWTFDVSTGQMSAVGERRRGLWSIHQVTPTLIAARDGIRSVMIDLDSRTSTTLIQPRAGCSFGDVAIAGPAVAVACEGPRNTRVTLYRMGQ